ncbi:hypothetical protein FOZ63_022973, partial [Perkinsus olseni]
MVKVFNAGISLLYALACMTELIYASREGVQKSERHLQKIEDGSTAFVGYGDDDGIDYNSTAAEVAVSKRLLVADGGSCASGDAFCASVKPHSYCMHWKSPSNCH